MPANGNGNRSTVSQISDAQTPFVVEITVVDTFPSVGQIVSSPDEQVEDPERRFESSPSTRSGAQEITGTGPSRWQ
jgi:hypothetical protein